MRSNRRSSGNTMRTDSFSCVVGVGSHKIHFKQSQNSILRTLRLAKHPMGIGPCHTDSILLRNLGLNSSKRGKALGGGSILSISIVVVFMMYCISPLDEIDRCLR